MKNEFFMPAFNSFWILLFFLQRYKHISVRKKLPENVTKFAKKKKENKDSC